MFNVILTSKDKSVVLFTNMEYNQAFTIAAHMNTLTATAAKKMGQAVKTFFSVIKNVH